jgi:transcriptional regulator with XRE-family HTH domain
MTTEASTSPTDRPPADSFGTLLRRHRLAAALTQEELAERAGLGVRSISDLERGAPHAPRKDTVALLAEALALGPAERRVFELEARRLSRPTVPNAAPVVDQPALFLCYAREDGSVVERLRADLARHSLSDGAGFGGTQPGTADWEEAVREGIRACQAVLLVASPAARRSRYVKAEVAVAEMYGRPIVPVWVAGEEWLDCVPLVLSGTRYIDARDQRYPQAVAEAASLLRTLVPAVPVTVLNRPTADRADGPAAERSGVQPGAAVQPAAPRNPYKGLRAFTEQDKDDFFGRAGLVDELLAALGNTGEGPRFLAVVGPSGSGKSSVVLAGLLPRLRAGALPGSAGWTYLPPLLPGAHPLEALSITLGSSLPLSLATLRADLDASERGLHLLAARLAPQASGRVVLVLDQTEELFTLSAEEERERFIALLVMAAGEPQGRTLVVLTLRADFYDRPLAYPALGRLLEGHSKAVLPMGLADLRAAIEGPAGLPD